MSRAAHSIRSHSQHNNPIHTVSDYLDRALEEATGAAQPADVANFVARASAQQRQEAAARVAAVSGPGSSRVRAWATAALLLVGAMVLWAVWRGTTEDDVRSAAQDPWVDPVVDPKRVVPETVEELRALLKQVDSVSLRMCSYTPRLAPNPVVLDIDKGLLGFLPLEREDHQQTVVDILARSSEREIGVRRDFRPDLRVLLTLKDGRHLHCLLQALEYQSIRVEGMEFRDHRKPSIWLLGHTELDLRFGSLAAQGVACHELGRSTMLKDGSIRYLHPSDSPSLRCYEIGEPDLSYGLGRFTELRHLDLSGSAMTLGPKSLQPSQWTLAVRGVFAKLEHFGGSGLLFSDATAAASIRAMPRLTRLDLAGCQDVGVVALAAIADLEGLTEVDLRGSRGWTVADLGVLGSMVSEASVLLSPTDIADVDRGAVTKVLGARLRWVD